MSYKLTEKDVLQRLKIKDFRNVTKDHVIAMASMLDQMDPEVAKAVIAQIPELSKTISSIVSDYKETISKSIEANEKSNSKCQETDQKIIDSLLKQLDRTDITSDQYHEILKTVNEISLRMNEKDTENKKWLANCISAFKWLGGTAMVVCAGVFGLKYLDGNNS